MGPLTGETRSTGGRGAHGDLDGGAGLVELDGTLSLAPLEDEPAVLAWRSAFAPSLRMVGLGPIEVIGFGAAGTFGATGASLGASWGASLGSGRLGTG